MLLEALETHPRCHFRACVSGVYHRIVYISRSVSTVFCLWTLYCDKRVIFIPHQSNGIQWNKSWTLFVKLFWKQNYCFTWQWSSNLPYPVLFQDDDMLNYTLSRKLLKVLICVRNWLLVDFFLRENNTSGTQLQTKITWWDGDFCIYTWNFWWAHRGPLYLAFSLTYTSVKCLDITWVRIYPYFDRWWIKTWKSVIRQEWVDP